MKKSLLLLLVLLPPLLVSLPASAQEDRQVTGTVISAEDNLPIPGVNVIVEGTTKGTTTDIDGNFSLSLADNENMLVFSFVGFKSVVVDATGQTTISVTLEPDVTALEEIVVVGYGVQRKRDVTGTIASLKAEEIVDKPQSNPLNVLQGKVAGVTVTNSGQAGAAPTIRIRGVGSISGTNPLYIVDGIFATNIDFVNPNDIASVEVLKDASSLAIYGVQGANGVIIITTKRANKGETNINVSSYVGFQRVLDRDKIRVTNADQFKMLYNEQLGNLGEPLFDFSGYNADMNWQDEILRDAIINNNSISIASGTEKNQANFSLNYFRQDGVVKYDAYKRYTARLRDEYTVNEHLKVGGDISLFRWERDPTTANLNAAVWAAPVYSIRDENGNWNPSPTFQRAQVGNPVAMMEINKGKTISEGYRLVASAFAEVHFLKDFTWKSVFYTDLGFNKSRSYTPLYEVGTGDERAQFNDVTRVTQEQRTFTGWQMDHTLTYTTNFNEDHDLTLLAGITSQYKGDDFITGGRQSSSPLNIPDDPDFWYLGISQEIANMANDGGASEQVFLSFLFRANYAFQGKYLLNASYRRDGTSKFAPSQRWGDFGSVGVGWVVTEEGFMRDQTAINFLKLKGSWGRLGNDKIGNYLFYPTLNNSTSAVFGENVYPAVSPAYIPNPGLRWEIMEGTEVGLEMNTLDDRLAVEAAYYSRKTHDILADIPLPAAVGTANTMKSNAGTILNRGVELTLTWMDNFSDNWGYSISANATTIHNEVLSIGDNIDYSIVKVPVSVTKIGQPIGAFFGLIQEGIFQTEEEVAAAQQAGAKVGDIRYKDVDGDGVVDLTKDRTFIGSPTPDFMYGFTASISYGNFDLGAEFQGVTGNYIYKQRATATFAIVNYEANRLGRWTGPGTSNREPILDNTRSANFQPSTYFLDEGDYFRIRNISLAYNLGETLLDRLHLKGGKIYVNAQNPITFTKATGYSPEVGSNNTGDRGDPLSFGVDNGVYPLPATYTLGVNLNF